MGYTPNLGLKTWSETENPTFELWRTELNGEGDSADVAKIDRFAKEVRDNIEEIRDNVNTAQDSITNGQETMRELEEKVNNNKDSIDIMTIDVETLKAELIKATSDEAIEGIRNDRYMTPFLVSEVLKFGGASQPNQAYDLKRVIKSVIIDTENQKEITIPMDDFREDIHYFEMRVGGVPFFHERYTVQNGKVVLNADEVGFAEGKRVDFVFLYLDQVGDNRLPIHGSNIGAGTISENKLNDELKEKLNTVGEHTHQDLEQAIDGKADRGHIHDDLVASIDGKADSGHTHTDLEEAIATKADVNHTHSDFDGLDDLKREVANKAEADHEHQDLSDGIANKADRYHSHKDLEDGIASKADANHTHEDLENAINGKAEAGHTHEEFEALQRWLDGKAKVDHTHTDVAPSLHASEHGVDGKDPLTVVEDMLSDDLKRKINYSQGGGIGFPEIDQALADIEQLKQDVAEKAEATHSHEDLEQAISTKADEVHTHDDLVELINSKADDATVSQAMTEVQERIETVIDTSLTELSEKVDTKADSSHTHTDKADVTYVDSSIDTAKTELTEVINTKADASHEHDGYLKTQPLIITDQDWNTLKTIGVYRVENMSGENRPPNAYAYGTLEVLKNVYTVTQRYTTHAGSTVYVRTHWDDDRAWEEWSMVYSTRSKPTPAEIGASAEGHTHTASQISGLPASLPANGGNADTVDGLHGWQLGTLSANGASHGTAYPLYVKHNAHGDGRFKLMLDTHETRVDYATQADYVGGVAGANVARQYVNANGVDISDTNAKQFYGTCVTQNSSAPNTDWWHIINVPHSDNNGYGGQLAIGYHGTNNLMVRSANGTTWGNWYDVIGNIELAKTMGGSSSNMCVITSVYGGLSPALASSNSTSVTSNAEINSQVGGWAESGGAVIVPKTGTYLCMFMGGFEVSSGSVNSSNVLNVEVGLVKNGSGSVAQIAPQYSNISSSYYYQKWNTFASAYRYSMARVVSLNQGDSLTLRAHLGSYVNNNPLTCSIRITPYIMLMQL